MRDYPLENKCVICGNDTHADDSFSLWGENWHCIGCAYSKAEELGMPRHEYLNEYVWKDKEDKKFKLEPPANAFNFLKCKKCGHKGDITEIELEVTFEDGSKADKVKCIKCDEKLYTLFTPKECNPDRKMTKKER
jgi:hypothetical protein